MKTRKRIVKTAYGLIAVLVIVLIGLLVHQQRLIRKMAAEQQEMIAMSAQLARSLLGNNADAR